MGVRLETNEEYLSVLTDMILYLILRNQHVVNSGFFRAVVTSIFYILKELKTPESKEVFLRRHKRKISNILDVGCGNSSCRRIKNAIGPVRYVGLDIMDYNQDKDSLDQMDEYILATAIDFDFALSSIDEAFDFVLSSHNLEHCNNPYRVLGEMINRLGNGGWMYISFPCDSSHSYPSRIGTLNFYDDPTHKYLIDFDKVIQIGKLKGLKLTFAAKRYQPLIGWFVGLLMEPFSIISGKVLWGTWEYYGFESIIIFRRD